MKNTIVCKLRSRHLHILREELVKYTWYRAVVILSEEAGGGEGVLLHFFFCSGSNVSVLKNTLSMKRRRKFTNQQIYYSTSIKSISRTHPYQQRLMLPPPPHFFGIGHTYTPPSTPPPQKGISHSDQGNDGDGDGGWGGVGMHRAQPYRGLSLKL